MERFEIRDQDKPQDGSNEAIALYFGSDDGRFGVVITRAALEAVVSLCAKAGSKETGGVLVGYYNSAHNNCIVTEATPPPRDSDATRMTFQRGTQGLTSLLRRRWRDQQRFYVGEWHLHPGGPCTPSDTDRLAARSIANDHQIGCPEPILWVVGGSAANWTHCMEVFPKGEDISALILKRSWERAKVEPRDD